MKNSTIALIGIVLVVVLGLGYYLFGYAQINSTSITSSTVTTGSSTGATTTNTVTTSDSNYASPGEHCGGNMATAKTCVAGYTCTPTPGSHLPFGDVGGTCTQS